MILNPHEMDPALRYKVATGTVVPRPIAWVSTITPDGTPNVAPFSYFTIASSSPLTMLFSAGHKPDGSRKDSWVNAEAVGDFVINLVSEETAAAMNETATLYEYGVSEFEKAGLTPLASEVVRSPRVGEAKVSFECTLTQILEIGSSGVVIGEVQRIHLADEVFDGRYVHLEALQPVGRLFGNLYCRVRDVFELVRRS